MKRERHTWASALSLEDFGAVMADTLRDDPWHEGNLCPETAEILDDLIILNRRGLLTTCSQPGMPFGADDAPAQRAFVEGLASESLAVRIGALTLNTDLIVFAYEPGGSTEIPLTAGENTAVTIWLETRQEWLDDLREQTYYRQASRAGREVLQGARYVIAIDPKWGRKQKLWRALRKATRPLVNP